MQKNYFKALAILLGYIIGVGMFGLPFLVSRSGLLPFFVFIVLLGLAQYFLHLIYANVILVTKDYHQLPGYAGLYLGKKWKKITALAKITGDIGALLAYIIITGVFINQLLAPYFGGNEFFYATLLFAIQSFVIFFGVKVLARAELAMTLFLLLVMVGISFKGFPLAHYSNYSLIDWRFAFLPFGAMIMALDGSGSIPIIIELLKRRKDSIRNIIRLAFIIPATVIILFTLVVVGITGTHTTPDALSGIKVSFGDGVVVLALIFGILTMVTSYLGVFASAQEMLEHDFKFPKRLAWIFITFVPYALYVIGFQNLINVISFAGGVSGGACAIVLILIFLQLKKKKGCLVIFKQAPSRALTTTLICLYLCGIVYEIVNFLH